MLIRVTPPHAIKSSEITEESVYKNRREFLRAAGLLGVAAATVSAPRVAEAMARFRRPDEGPRAVGPVPTRDRTSVRAAARGERPNVGGVRVTPVTRATYGWRP